MNPLALPLSLRFALLSSLLPLLASASVPNGAFSSTSSAVPSSTSSPTTNPMPTPTDSAPGSSTTPNASYEKSAGIFSYYFLFLAVVIAVAGVSAFLLWRRRRRRWDNNLGPSERGPYGPDFYSISARMRAHDRAGAYLARGRWRTTSQEEMGQEEGLNELGEAPPAYAPPKTREEIEREEEAARAMHVEGGGQGITLPEQALTREMVGVKPPDYTETHVAGTTRTGTDTELARRSVASGEGSSSSAQPEDDANHGRERE